MWRSLSWTADHRSVGCGGQSRESENGLCLTGTSNGCPKAYNDVGVEGLFALVPSGAFQVALAAAFLVPSISEPFAMAAGVGFATR